MALVEEQSAEEQSAGRQSVEVKSAVEQSARRPDDIRVEPDAADGAAPATMAPQRAKRSPIWIELAWLIFLIWIYDWLQDLAPLRRKLAFVDAHHMYSLERRLGLDPERVLDHWLAHHNVLAYISSDFYDNAIFAVTFGFAVYLYWWRPDLYRPLRNILVLANLIGFAVFLVFPVAPPRMLHGFIDVVEKSGGLGAWHDTLVRHADQLAAMPSMHLGYAVWCGIAAWQLARSHRGKVIAVVFGVGYPVLTALVVMSTGNHYLFDVLAGTVVTLGSVVIVRVVPEYVRRGVRVLSTNRQTTVRAEAAREG